MENLGKVGGSQQRLDAVEACLWKGNVARAVHQFDDWQHERVERFSAYLQKQGMRSPYDGDFIYWAARGKDIAANRQLLHRHCHDQKTAADNNNLAASGIYDKDQVAEEPCEPKGSSMAL